MAIPEPSELGAAVAEFLDETAHRRVGWIPRQARTQLHDHAVPEFGVVGDPVEPVALPRAKKRLSREIAVLRGESGEVLGQSGREIVPREHLAGRGHHQGGRLRKPPQERGGPSAMRDYLQSVADIRFAMERAHQLEPVLSEIPGFAGLEIVSAGPRVSYSDHDEPFRVALAGASLLRSSPPVVLRQVQLSMHHLLTVSAVVRTRRGQLLDSGVKIHFLGVDVPTNRGVARVESGLVQRVRTLGPAERARHHRRAEQIS